MSWGGRGLFCLRLNVCWTVEIGFESIASNHFSYNTKIISIQNRSKGGKHAHEELQTRVSHMSIISERSEP